MRPVHVPLDVLFAAFLAANGTDRASHGEFRDFLSGLARHLESRNLRHTYEIPAAPSDTDIAALAAASPDMLSDDGTVLRLTPTGMACHWPMSRSVPGAVKAYATSVAARRGPDPYPIRVRTPLGDLVAYPSIDPRNPGIFIDLDRGDGTLLNLSGTECNIPEDGDPSTSALVTHVWGDAMQEDTTTDETHVRVDAWKEYWRERDAGTDPDA